MSLCLCGEIAAVPLREAPPIGHNPAHHRPRPLAAAERRNASRCSPSIATAPTSMRIPNASSPKKNIPVTTKPRPARQRRSHAIHHRAPGILGTRLHRFPRRADPAPRNRAPHRTVLPLARALKNPKIADVGTGSGAIALALAKELPHAEIHATDISPAALEIAEANAARLQLEFRALNQHAPERRLFFHDTDLLTGVEQEAFDFGSLQSTLRRHVGSRRSSTRSPKIRAAQLPSSPDPAASK